MSLESIYRVVSHAYKAASEASGGTADEQSALDVLGGLSALLESRIHLHKQATRAAPSAAPAGAPAPAAAATPRPPAAVPGRAAASTAAAPAPAKRPTPDAAGDYDLK